MLTLSAFIRAATSRALATASADMFAAVAHGAAPINLVSEFNQLFVGSGHEFSVDEQRSRGVVVEAGNAEDVQGIGDHRHDQSADQRGLDAADAAGEAGAAGEQDGRSTVARNLERRERMAALRAAIGERIVVIDGAVVSSVTSTVATELLARASVAVTVMS